MQAVIMVWVESLVRWWTQSTTIPISWVGLSRGGAGISDKINQTPSQQTPFSLTVKKSSLKLDKSEKEKEEIK